MRGNEALNTLPWVVGGVNGLERGVCLSEGSVRDGSAQEGEIQQRQGGCAGLGLIAVNQQGTRGGVLLRCESEKMVEGVELEERDGRIDDVEVEVAGVAQGEVVRMVALEAAGIADGALVARGLAGMDDGELGRARTAAGLVSDVQTCGYGLHGGYAPV